MNSYHLRILVFVILVAVIMGCGNYDTTLLDNLKVRPIVNPNVGLLMGNSDLYASMIDDQTIVGYGNDFVYQTNDFFQNFSISNQHELDYFRGEWSTLWVSQKSLIGYERNQYSTEITLGKTVDFGLTWKELVVADGCCTRFVEVEVFNDDEAIIIGGNSSTLVYLADIQNGSIEKVGQIAGYSPVKIKMINENVGFMILRFVSNPTINTYITKTQDGGRTWSNPKEVSDIDRYYNLEVLNNNSVIVYDPIPYISRDSGESWSRISIGFIVDFFTLEDKIFAVERSGEVYRSDDEGLTWTFLGKADVLLGGDEMEISFYNEDTGIIVYHDQLFHTDDGGYSWRKLIYPYSYTRD